MENRSIAVIGYGNVGKLAADAICAAQDLRLAGIVWRRAEPGASYNGAPIVRKLDELGKVDVAVLALPSRMVPESACALLERGISTVDSFDIHTEIPAVQAQLHAAALKGGAVAVLSAGWDPGSDSVIRALMQAMAPRGMTDTDFGPGMSMGHSVAARSKEGVADALSMTIPKGSGLHRRMVYVQLKPGADPAAVEQSIHEDAYFSHDETHVRFVEDVDSLRDHGHGVQIQRYGGSGDTHDQQFRYEMRIDNPGLTAQVMVSCARAAARQKPGAYTMIELPVVDLLPGERAEWVKRLV